MKKKVNNVYFWRVEYVERIEIFQFSGQNMIEINCKNKGKGCVNCSISRKNHQQSLFGE